MAKKKKEQDKIEVKVAPLNHSTLKLEIVGKSPLLMDRLPEEVLMGIVEKQTGVAKSNKKKVRVLDKEFDQAIHWIDKKKRLIGFPAAGFKRGMMECTSFVGDKFFSKKLVSGAVRIINHTDGLVPLKYKKIGKLQHNVGSNVKFSPKLDPWSAELVIQYDGNNITPTDIVNLLNYAGFYVGVGAWRPKCRDGGSGEFGMYEVKVK